MPNRFPIALGKIGTGSISGDQGMEPADATGTADATGAAATGNAKHKVTRAPDIRQVLREQHCRFCAAIVVCNLIDEYKYAYMVKQVFETWIRLQRLKEELRCKKTFAIVINEDKEQIGAITNWYNGIFDAVIGIENESQIEDAKLLLQERTGLNEKTDFILVINNDKIELPNLGSLETKANIHKAINNALEIYENV